MACKAHELQTDKTEVQENDWQLNLSLTERNEYMLNHELATDVTFQVSGSTQSK